MFANPQLNAEQNMSSQTILILGDSLSAAYGMSAEDGWVHLLGQRLAEQNKPAQVINSSVSGSTAAGGLQRLGAALARHPPDIVVLELGANDGLQGKPLPYIERMLRQLIEQSQAAGAKVLLVGIRLPPNFGPMYTEPFFRQYQKLAEEYGTAYIPFLLEGVAGNGDLMMSDGLHPNEQAQEIILETVWQELTTLF